jgi:hypothetical protein
MHTFGSVAEGGEAGLEAADVRCEGISNFTDEMKKSPCELHLRTILSLEGCKSLGKLASRRDASWCWMPDVKCR